MIFFHFHISHDSSLMPIFFESFLEKILKDPIPIEFIQTLGTEIISKFSKIDWKSIG